MMRLEESLSVLAVTLLGIGLTWLGIAVGWWAILIALLVPVGLGKGMFWLGKRRLTTAPEEAVRWMEWWVLVPGTVAALAQCIVIILGMRLKLDDAGGAEVRQLWAATIGAVSTFLVVTFVRAAEEADEAWAGKRIREAFFRAAERSWRFPKGSTGEMAIYSEGWKGLHGWGREARRRRAREVADALSREDPEDGAGA